jgi:Response regulator containing CheY-like receiver, AAA-type ATPase, and DNA-binding domains
VISAFRILLEDAGYRVSQATTIAAALAIAGTEPVDLMLLDLTLPDGDGLSALAELRKSGALPRVTLAMTGDSEIETRRRCLAEGCADVLVKPVPIKELRAVIARNLS